MKYFSYELIATANRWVEQTAEKMREAETLLGKAGEDYRRELDSLRPRLSRAAWDFFRHGFARTGLHDANLLSFNIGDGLDYRADGKAPFRLNLQKLSARLEFLNYEQDFHYTFEFRGVTRAQCDLFSAAPGGPGVGDLFTYELVSIDDDHLQFGCLFAVGASITIQFRKLIFRRRRTNR